MTQPPLGKLDPDALQRLVLPHLGAARAEVLVGPRAGSDAALVRVGAGRVLAITTDPLSIVPALGIERSAKLSCHLLASDLWTTGLAPSLASVCLNLPPAISDADLERYQRAMGETWAALDVAVVTGHTGRYPGIDYSIVGAATLIGMGDEGRTVTPAMARPGDRVLVTKGCAIEATAIAAHLLPEAMAARLDPDGLERARAMLDDVSVVRECRALVGIGVRDRGITAMHDATEGGVLGGLLELARAAGHDLRIERAKIPLSPEAVAACAAFGDIDPYWTMSEGSLIATVRPERVGAALAALDEAGVAGAEVGEVVAGSGELWLTEADGTVGRIRASEPDPYWPAYARAVQK